MGAYEDRIGTVIADRYRLDEIIGRGGLGVVYGGLHVVTERAIAVKILHPRFAEKQIAVQRFMLEAKAAARLNHPNVVEVLDMGLDQAGTVYLVLERLSGEPLDQRLRFEGALEMEEAFGILSPVVDAVASAHRAGIIHRDLKPGNIFIHRDIRDRSIPKLLDFGIAKFLDAASDPGLTADGTQLGTLRYMSPEQARGERAVGPETDVWSMGVVFYQCLTGQLPFRGANPALVSEAIESGVHIPIRELAAIPPPIGGVIERALHIDRTQRYASMGDFAAALADARATAEFGPEPTTTRAPAPQLGRAAPRAASLETTIPIPPEATVSSDISVRKGMSTAWMGAFGASIGVLVIATTIFVSAEPVAPTRIAPLPPTERVEAEAKVDLPPVEIATASVAGVARAPTATAAGTTGLAAERDKEPPESSAAVSVAPPPAKASSGARKVKRVAKPARSRSAPRVPAEPPRKTKTSDIIREW